MRQRRLKAPAPFPVAHYHCMSRVVNRDFVFGPQEREQFVRLLREYEHHCGNRWKALENSPPSHSQAKTSTAAAFRAKARAVGRQPTHCSNPFSHPLKSIQSWQRPRIRRP